METPEVQAARDGGVIAEEGRSLLAFAESGWDLPVPTCPGWDVGTLLTHAGGAQRWATANLTAGPGQRVHRRDVAAPPEESGGRLDWYRTGLDTLVETLRKTDPFAEVWAFGASGDHRAWWWARRMAQETGVHRWDAANAAGQSPPAVFPPAVAAAGIDEYLVDLLPRMPAELFDRLAGTLHVHATDTDGEWVFDLDHPGAPARREHAKSDTAVRGPASDLLLWLWNRQPAAGHLEVIGDGSAVAGWSRLAL